MKRLLMLAVLGLGCATQQGATGSGTGGAALDDLRALDKQGAWLELLQSAKSIAPSKRDAEWEALVDRAAGGALAAIDVKDEMTAAEALSTADSLMVSYPSLKKSPTYLGKRADLAVKSFGWVYGSANSREWVQRVLKFTEQDEVTPHLAQRMAKDVVLKRLIAVTAFPVYQLAFKRDGDKVCTDTELPKVILGVARDGSWLEEVTHISTKQCWSQLKAPLLDGLKKSESRTEVAYLCKVITGMPETAEATKSSCKAP